MVKALVKSGRYGQGAAQPMEACRIDRDALAARTLQMVNDILRRFPGVNHAQSDGIPLEKGCEKCISRILRMLCKRWDLITRRK